MRCNRLFTVWRHRPWRVFRLEGVSRMAGRAQSDQGWRRAVTGWGAIWSLLLSLGIALAAPAARASDGGILFITSFSPAIGWTDAMVDSIRDELVARGRPLNLYVEYLDRARLPVTPTDEEWASFLAAKYRDRRPDVIIADGDAAIRFVAAKGRSLFGSAPLVGIYPDFDDLGDAAKAVAVKVTTGPHIDRTVALALEQWPATRTVEIVSDDTRLSDHLAHIIRSALARRASHGVEVEDLDRLTVPELEARVANLPPNSIVFYTHMLIDRAGRQVRPEEVSARLAAVSSAPIYVLFDEEIGTGVVGGVVNDSAMAGRIAVDAALGLVYGTGMAATRADSPYSSRPVFDWRQLRRWGIDERTLPPDAEIRYRHPSMIEAYFAEAVLGLAVIVVLAAGLFLISILFVQRDRLSRALQDANSRLEFRVAERTREIERALSGEQAARQRLRTFVDMATHEFKTPLAVIDSSAQMLEMLVDTRRAGVGSRLALIRRSIRRIIDLVETCLNGERIDEELPVKLSPFNPAQLLNRVAERQRGLGAAVRLGDLAGLPDDCVGDPALLGIALDALLDNARRYGPLGGDVDLEASCDGDRLIVTVGDRGPGVPEGEVSMIFEKYFRGSHGHSSAGTGIGLNVVRTIAELHHGGIAYQPRAGGGSLFRLTIPLHPKGEARETPALTALS